jgi:hypothetical protein
MSNSREINLPRHHQMISANQHMKDLLLQVQFNLCDKKKFRLMAMTKK